MAGNVGATLVVARKARARFFAALRMTGTGKTPCGGTGGAEPRPYGFCMCAETIGRAIRESPLRR